MAETVEELTFNYKNEEGQLVRKELSKEVLSKGAWATLMFLYQDLDRRNNVFRAPKVSIVRYKKSNGVYRKQSSFNISSERQARQIMEILEQWYASEHMRGFEQEKLEGEEPPEQEMDAPQAVVEEPEAPSSQPPLSEP